MNKIRNNYLLTNSIFKSTENYNYTYFVRFNQINFKIKLYAIYHINCTVALVLLSQAATKIGAQQY